MIICSYLNITTKNIEEMLKKRIDLDVKGVYTTYQQDSKHIPCSCCPRQIHKEIERGKV